MHASQPGTRRRAMAAAVGGLGLIVVGLLGALDDERAGLSCIDDSPDCVDQRQVTLKSMLADRGSQVGQGVRDAAGPCLGCPAVRLPQPQEGAELRGAGDRAPRGGQRAEGAEGTRRQEHVTGAGLPHQHVRRRGQPRSSPPRCGRAAARREVSLRGGESSALQRDRPAVDLRPHRQVVGADGRPRAGRRHGKLGRDQDVIERHLRQGQRPGRPGRHQDARGSEPGRGAQLAERVRPGRGVEVAGEHQRPVDVAHELRQRRHLPLVQPGIAARPVQMRADDRQRAGELGPHEGRHVGGARLALVRGDAPDAGRLERQPRQQRQRAGPLVGAVDLEGIGGLQAGEQGALVRPELRQHDDVGGRGCEIALEAPHVAVLRARC